MADAPGVPLLDTIAYIQAEARQLVARRKPFPPDADEITRRASAFREKLAELVGSPPLAQAELGPKVVACERLDEDLVIEKVYFASSVHWRVPAFVVRPAEQSGPLPGVVVVHGWGESKLNMLAYRKALARAGYVSIIVDNPMAGEHQTRILDANEYQFAAMPAALAVGWNMIGMGVHDIRRAADYLQTRDEVDADRLAISGLCWGAMQTWVAAALDERFRVVIPVCGTSTYEALLLEYTTYTRHTCMGVYIPGILRHGDWQDIAACCAPRPLLVMNNVNDNWFPVSGFGKVCDEMRTVYAALGAPGNFRALLRDTVHEVTPEFAEEAIGWLDEHL
jgi:dienelactone hydrolase